MRHDGPAAGQPARVEVVLRVLPSFAPEMAVALGAFVVLPGLAIGSFLNVVAARLPERRSLFHPRSACGACSTPIAWYDNIPLLSYAVLRGRCRSCRARISALYPAVELATAALLVGCLIAFGLSLQRLPRPSSARRWS